MKLQLQSGRWIHLSRLDQHLTYGGLLAGRPNRLLNDSKIEQFIADARRRFPGLGGPVLIPLPSRRTEANADSGAGEQLGAVSCRAVFESDELKKADSEPYSSLVVLWFQDAFALPIEPAVLSELERVDWESQAKDSMP